MVSQMNQQFSTTCSIEGTHQGQSIKKVKHFVHTKYE